MKKLLLMLVMTTVAIGLNAQDFEPIGSALSRGNASDLADWFDATIDITIEGKTASLNRSDAQNKMRSFFMDNEPRNFEIVHKGVSKSEVHYMIGRLITGSDEYRITIYLHKSSDKYKIQSLEIEKD